MDFKMYADYVRMKELPEGLEEFCAAWDEETRDTLCDHDFFQQTLLKTGANEDSLRRMKKALDAIERDEKLLKFSRFLVSDLCAARHRCDFDDYLSLIPMCLTGDERDLYALVMMISCIETSMDMLKNRGVPQEYYADIPFRPLRGQIKKLNAGDAEIADFPWDLNFYTCSIFLMDRFYFIPFRYGEPPVFFRNKETSDVKALWRAGDFVRRDGQLNGVNGVFDKDAFQTAWAESGETVTAYPVLPEGLIGQTPVTLDKFLWKEALPEGSLLLALHIPGGEGYEPTRVRHSMQLAFNFFAKYFPELDIKGFWSESWLYDPGLRAILPNDGRIVSVQKQFYCYPTMEGDEQIKHEVFHTDSPDMNAEGKTSLQKKLLESWRNGIRFHCTGMVVLKEETDLIGQMPYQKA